MNDKKLIWVAMAKGALIGLAYKYVSMSNYAKGNRNMLKAIENNNLKIVDEEGVEHTITFRYRFRNPFKKIK